jgi:hypothetical protein
LQFLGKSLVWLPYTDNVASGGADASTVLLPYIDGIVSGGTDASTKFLEHPDMTEHAMACPRQTKPKRKKEALRCPAILFLNLYLLESILLLGAGL